MEDKTQSSETQTILSQDFSSPAADLRLRSADGVMFDVFSRILIEASPIFRDMASLPIEPDRGESTLHRCVDLTEEAETLDLILRFIYPTPEPSIATFDVLKQLIKTADKYLLEGTMHSLRRILLSPPFVEREPLRAYAIACMYSWDPEAKTASRYSLQKDVLQCELYEELAMISARDLLRLIKLHQTRAAAIISILNTFGPSACTGPVESQSAGAGPIWWVEFKARAKEELRVRPVTSVIFQPLFLAQCVNLAVGAGCNQCALNYLSPATQARLIQLKEKIDALPDTV